MAPDQNDSRLTDFVLSPVFVSIVIAIVTLATFVRVLGADFVMWDDNWCIYENPGLGGLSLENLRLIFTNKTVSSSWYTPLTGLRWSITYQFFKLNPFGYHLGNWLFHGADAVLVFLVLRKLLSGRGAAAGNSKRITISAALAGLVWSLHPLRVEPTAWAANAYGQALLFLLICLLCYLRAAETHNHPAGYYRNITASVFLFAASLLSMPLGLGFVVVLFVLDVYPLGRLGGDIGWLRTAAARRVLVEKIPFIAVVLVIVLITAGLHFTSPRGGHQAVSVAEFGLLARFMQAMYILAYYAWRPWYPVHLAPVYATLVFFEPLSPLFIASALAVLGTAVALVLLRRRRPIGLAAGICHLALLAPVLGLLEHPHYPVDRYSMMVAIVWSALLAAWLVSLKRRPFVYTTLSLLSVIVVLAALSFRQCRVWNNSVTLFEHMIHNLGNDPYRSDIHWRLGIVQAQQGNTEQAIEQLHRTLEIRPYHTIAHYYLGKVLQLQGEPNEIISRYQQKLQSEPDDVLSHYHLGIMLAQQGNTDQALAQFNKVLALKPSFTAVYRDIAEAHNGLAVTLSRQGRFDEAVEHFSTALAIMPDCVEAHSNLGYVLTMQGRADEAIEQLTEALRINPNLAITHYFLGCALSNTGKIDQAVSQLRQALRLRADWAEPMNNLAWLLATHKDSSFYNPQEALEFAERSCRLSGYSRADFLDTLAAAYAATGRFTEAVSVARTALDLAQRQGNSQLTEKIKKHLSSYTASEPYAEP
jgi:tetratricopeptide (TPR) repeat protein